MEKSRREKLMQMEINLNADLITPQTRKNIYE
jgi:hypothetical protein